MAQWSKRHPTYDRLVAEWEAQMGRHHDIRLVGPSGRLAGGAFDTPEPRPKLTEATRPVSD